MQYAREMNVYRKRRQQYKPSLSRAESPRVSKRQRAAVGAICRKNIMPEADVLRYGLEAVILGVSHGNLALQYLKPNETYDEMVSIRLSRDIRPLVDALGRERRHLPKRNDVLRACLDTMIINAKKSGFAWLVALREKFI
jgi:hypothetical protein